MTNKQVFIGTQAEIPNSSFDESPLATDASGAKCQIKSINACAATPMALGMEKAIEMVAGQTETFFYRNNYMRIIDYQVINSHRWSTIRGPLIYAVTDHEGLIRYIGKHESKTPLRARWLRHNKIHHQKGIRNKYLEHLDSGKGPLRVWSVSVAELKCRLPDSMHRIAETKLAAGLEALWIHRWKKQLHWNSRIEHLDPEIDDGEFWKCT